MVVVDEVRMTVGNLLVSVFMGMWESIVFNMVVIVVMSMMFVMKM